MATGDDSNQGETDSVSDVDLHGGDQVGEYVIESKLGAGGFGTVYRAKHPLIGKDAAVKVLSRKFSADPEMVSRFMSEARAVNTIGHDNIVDIFSFGTLADGRRYFVMELLDGVPLDAYLEEMGPLEPPHVIAIMKGVAKALDAAHESGIIHRDLKPDNVFVAFDDEGKPKPKLLDFGIAKLRGDDETGHRTRTGAPIGTPHYMSPEQCLGKDIDGRTDVYAFGVVCFEALTGEPPFDAGSYLELMTKHTTAERPPASARRPGLGAAFDEALRKMMAKDPDERPRTLGEALGLLAAASGDPNLSASTPNLPLPQLSQREAVGEAKTVMDASSEVHQTAASPTRLPLIAAAVLVAGVGAYAVSGAFGTPAESAPAVQPEATASAATSATAEATALPSATVTAGAQASAPAAGPISITLTSKAKGAVAFVGDDELGKLPGPFTLEGKPGDKRDITVRAPGYLDETIEVTLAPDAELEVTLKPKPVKRLNSDLEEPDF